MFEENNAPMSQMPSQNVPVIPPPNQMESPRSPEPQRGPAFKLERNQILIIVAVLAVLIAGALIFTSSGGNVPSFLLGSSASTDELAKKAVDYINGNLLQPGQTATLVSSQEESGLVKITIKVGTNNHDSYITKDGKLFFPQAYQLKPPNSGNNPIGNTGGNASFDITSENHIRGNISAPITLVEFSDFECPFCERHTPTLEKILLDYKDKLRLVYKHYPLVSIHPNAQKAAEASECASEQGKFWEYHDMLFANQKSGLSVDKFKSWAVQLGLSANQFNNCLDTSKYKSKVETDLAEGSSKGVTGTPGTFVNGELVEGAVPYDTFKAKIDALLSK